MPTVSPRISAVSYFLLLRIGIKDIVAMAMRAKLRDIAMLVGAVEELKMREAAAAIAMVAMMAKRIDIPTPLNNLFLRSMTSL